MNAVQDKVVIVTGAGRAFCAGGDIRQVREAVVDGDIDRGMAAFTDEYTLNNLIANYPKPYIALCSGVIMGGGMGVSAHGSHMVVTEDAFASMPEMNIGYITDVGMSWLLQNLPKAPSQSLGAFLGLTGYRMSPDDMLATGLATHKVATLDGVLDGIVAHGPGYVDTIALGAGESELLSLTDDIDSAFHGSWAEIQGRLDGKLAELVAKLHVPLERLQIHEQGARRVGHIRQVQRAVQVLRAAGEVPDQPGVDRAREQLAVFRALASVWHVVQDPRPLRGRRIRVVEQARLAQILRGVAVVVRAGVLPHDGVVDRLACCFVPDHGRFALVGQPERVDVLFGDVLRRKRLAQRPARVAPNLHRVVLDPALLWHVLGVLVLRLRDDGSVGARDAHARRRRALVNRRNQSHARDLTGGARGLSGRGLLPRCRIC